MLADQERDFIDNCSQDEVLTGKVYSRPGSEYLGELRIVMSQAGLKLVAREHRRGSKGYTYQVLPLARTYRKL